MTQRSGEGGPYSCGTLMAPWGAANIILVRVKRHDLMSAKKRKKKKKKTSGGNIHDQISELNYVRLKQLRE